MDYACAYVQQEALVMSEACGVERGVVAGGNNVVYCDVWPSAEDFGEKFCATHLQQQQRQQQNLT